MGQWGSCPEDSEGGQRGRTREPRGQAPTQQGEAGAGNLLGEVTLSRVHGTEGTQVVGRAPVWPRGDRTEHGQEPSVARSLGCGGGPEAERSQWRKDRGDCTMPGVWTDPSGNREWRPVHGRVTFTPGRGSYSAREVLAPILQMGPLRLGEVM